MDFGREGGGLHHDGYGRRVGDGGVPVYETLLGHSWGEVTRGEDEAPLAAAVFCVAQLFESAFDVLGGCAGDEGVVVVAGFFERLTNVGEEGAPLGTGDCDCLAS